MENPMIEAGNKTTTSNATLPAGVELTPESCEYIGIDEVLVSMKTNTGDTVSYSMSTASLVKSVNMSVNLINSCTAQVFRDLGVF
jgi:hypothetical protein